MTGLTSLFTPHKISTKHTQARSYPALLLVLLKDLGEVLFLSQQSSAIWIKATILFSKTNIDQLSLFLESELHKGFNLFNNI